MHSALVGLPGNTVVRITECPDVAFPVDRRRATFGFCLFIFIKTNRLTKYIMFGQFVSRIQNFIGSEVCVFPVYLIVIHGQV